MDQEQRTLVVENESQLRALVDAPIDERGSVHKIVFGLPKTRRAHSTTPTLRIECETLANIISSIGAPVVVALQDVHLTVDILPHIPAAADANYVVLLRPKPSLPVVDEDKDPFPEKMQLALPHNLFLSSVTAVAPGTHQKTDVRVVQACTIPLTPANIGDQQWLVLLGETAAFREAIVDVRSGHSISAVGELLMMLGSHVEDLSIRWGNPQDMLAADTDTIGHNFSIALCTSLSSLTLFIAYIKGCPAVARQQCLMNMALLGNVHKSTVRRVQLCISVQEESISGDIMGQVKQTPWRHLDTALGRFPNLEELSIVIKGRDELGCNEIWQEVEFPLRHLGGIIRFVRRQFCIV